MIILLCKILCSYFIYLISVLKSKYTQVNIVVPQMTIAKSIQKKAKLKVAWYVPIQVYTIHAFRVNSNGWFFFFAIMCKFMLYSHIFLLFVSINKYKTYNIIFSWTHELCTKLYEYIVLCIKSYLFNIDYVTYTLL